MRSPRSLEPAGTYRVLSTRKGSAAREVVYEIGGARSLLRIPLRGFLGDLASPRTRREPLNGRCPSCGHGRARGSDLAGNPSKLQRATGSYVGSAGARRARAATSRLVSTCLLLLPAACEAPSMPGGPSSPASPPRAGAAAPGGAQRSSPARRPGRPPGRGVRHEQWRIAHVEERIVARTRALRLLELLRELKGENVELVSVVRDGEVQRVTFLQTGAPPRAWTELITVQGGRWLVEPVDLLADTTRGERAREFAACLRRARVRVYVRAGDEASARQLRVLGPVRDGLVAACPGDPNCKRPGGLRLPVLEVGGRRFAGPRDRAFLEAATGCK